ncbi:intraflagellar transport protein 172 homolog isoform X2 [Rhopalosiphum maidis]|uniref:intraflagellar transport protein 172 homolog isoform X2 n=1 Tax=Rhopalosiphum maidis TaxID=43146 RepID=UPI000F000FD2|nr:intraflagellar transport protein 172 homolog isoform X2 [Rhopalosiphum maidis]
MKLKHLQSLTQQAEDGPFQVLAATWSPNNQKLAVCNNDRVVLLFDEAGVKRDKFPTKPAEHGAGRQSYTVKGLAFSPDSTRIAVGQTDNMVFVYKIGDSWGAKKVICNKFGTQSPVTCMLWMSEGPIIYGQLDGKIRAAHYKSNKSQTLYATGSYVVSLASNTRGTAFISGHADGSIVRYIITEGSSTEQQGRIVVHPVPPYALCWASGCIIAAGCDFSVQFYDQNGRSCKQFDYSPGSNCPDQKEFTVGCSSPSGQAVVIGSFNRLRLYSWSPSKLTWEEENVMYIPNMYTVSALAWKRDGSRIICGTLCGGMELFESVIKRTVWKNKFEMTYVGPSQVLVKPLNNESNNQSSHGVILKSQYGHEIEDVRVMGEDRYLIGRTRDTLLLGDMERNLLSEVVWPYSERNEKFYFENPSVCLIFNCGELTLVEYGNDQILATVRTEFVNPHLISVRLNERKQFNSNEENKKLAYLLDLKTICIVDLVVGVVDLQIGHAIKIDWLELNETGHKLLYRDKSTTLTLLDARTGHKEILLNGCSFVQWVIGSDVVVAQGRQGACVWYNIDTPDRVTVLTVAGDVMSVDRISGKTTIRCQEGERHYTYDLDERLVEFGTAVHDSDFGRAILYLESLEDSDDHQYEVDGMWQNLSDIGLQLMNLPVAARCLAGVGDYCKAWYLQETYKLAENFAKENNNDGMDCPEVWARIAVLNGQLQAAEVLYLEQNKVEKAIQMYLSLHKWENAIHLAESKNRPDVDDLKSQYHFWLLDTCQEEKAAEIKEMEGDKMSALQLYMKAGFFSKAAKLVQDDPELLADSVVEKVLSGLLRLENYHVAGELCQSQGNPGKAMEFYCRGNIYAKAVELARFISPSEVVSLEEKWGDFLVCQKQQDAAISHYIESGNTVKALEAAIGARQWKKSMQIMQVIEDKTLITKYGSHLAEHFKTVNDYKTAEKLYMECGMHREAIQLYLETGNWEKAHKLLKNNPTLTDLSEELETYGKKLENMGRIKEAEKLYIALEKIDLAINMYKNCQRYDEMMSLVSKYHSDLVSTTHVHLAHECETRGNYRAAEHHFVQAGEWKLAVKMYRSLDMWEEAYKIAKNNGGEYAAEQVAFLWAKSLGGDSAIKLLNRLGLLNECIDHASDSYQFDFAFELARSGGTERLTEVHYKYALVLEDDGKFQEAEKHFVAGMKPKEAVLMYIHNQDWDNAERVADQHDKSAMSDVLLSRAKIEFEAANYPRFEALMLRCHKPELIVKQYQEKGMWVEALKSCREYLPTKVDEVQAEYDRECGARVTRDINSLFAQASQWEQNGEFKTAVDCLLKVTSTNCKDDRIISKTLNEATRMTLKYLDGEECVDAAKKLGPRLIEYEEYLLAAKVFVCADMMKEAIDAFIAGDYWSKARKLSSELDSSFERYVSECYKDSLKREGKPEQLLADMDVEEALDMLSAQGKWSKCLDVARPHGQVVLHKYIALYATDLLREGNAFEALNLYTQYDVPAFPQNFNIYRRIALDVFSKREMDKVESYDIWAKLRDMFFKLMENTNQPNSEIWKEFEKYMFISHLYAMRCAFGEISSLSALVVKLLVALLRYTDIIPADKGYYEAGIAVRDGNRNAEAFVFLNHYLDITDAIADGQNEMIDDTDLQGTDFPTNVPLPQTMHVENEQHELVREWILTNAMDRDISQSLPTDQRKLYPSNLTAPDGGTYPVCIVSGWPVIDTKKSNAVTFENGRMAIKDDWTKVMTVSKTIQSSAVKQTLEFIAKWCGPPVQQYSFH